MKHYLVDLEHFIIEDPRSGQTIIPTKRLGLRSRSEPYV